VPEGLKSLYSSVDELILDLISRVTVGTAYTADNALVYDVVQQYRINDRKWINATADNFPATGITVTLPYPEGTDSSYEFTVLHMFTETSSRLGITAGGTETPTIRKTGDGLVVTLMGLSPVAVAWQEAGEETEATATEATTENAETESSAVPRPKARLLKVRLRLRKESLNQKRTHLCRPVTIRLPERGS